MGFMPGHHWRCRNGCNLSGIIECTLFSVAYPRLCYLPLKISFFTIACSKFTELGLFSLCLYAYCLTIPASEYYLVLWVVYYIGFNKANNLHLCLPVICKSRESKCTIHNSSTFTNKRCNYYPMANLHTHMNCNGIVSLISWENWTNKGDVVGFR